MKPETLSIRACFHLYSPAISRLFAMIVFASASAAGAQPAPTASTKPAAITAEQVTAEIAKFKLELINVPGSTASSVDSTRLRDRQEQATVLNLATNLGVWIEQGNYESALTTIQYVMERTQNPAYRKSLSALAVSITTLQASERASFPQRVRSLVQAIPEQMRKAKTREDLEAFEIEMSRVMQHFNQAGIPDAIRHVMEDQVQQLQHEMRFVGLYSAMLGAEADGEVDTAAMIGAQILKGPGYQGRAVPAREVVQRHLDAAEKRRNDSFSQKLSEFANAVQASKSIDALTSVQNNLESLTQKLRSRTESQQDARRYEIELEGLQAWSRIAELESKKKFSAALAEMTRWRARYPGQTTVIVTDAMMREKTQALQRRLLERGDDIVDPQQKLLGDALSHAPTLEELQKVAASIDGSLNRPNGADESEPDAAAITLELVRASAQIHSLFEMQSALKVHEWGRFWQTNRAVLIAARTTESGNPASRGRWSTKLDGMRLAMIREALAQSAELRELKLAIDDKKPLDQVMFDAADAAIAARDYRRAVTIFRTYIAFTYPENIPPRWQDAGPAATLLAELQGIELFAQASSFEAAGDLVPAVARYRAIIQLTGPRVPLAQATERLSNIGKNHPELLRDPPAPVAGDEPGSPVIRHPQR